MVSFHAISHSSLSCVTGISSFSRNHILSANQAAWYIDEIISR